MMVTVVTVGHRARSWTRNAEMAAGQPYDLLVGHGRPVVVGAGRRNQRTEPEGEGDQ